MTENKTHDRDAAPEQPLDPHLVDLILALGETEEKLRHHLPFDEYLHTLLEKAALEKKVADHRPEEQTKGYRSAS